MGNNADHSLAEIIRQAEIQQAQMAIKLQFDKNMAALQQAAPSLHERIKEFSPKRYQLSYSNDGYIDLVNTATRKSIYPGNPRNFCQQQINAFRTSPTVKGIGFEKLLVRNPLHIFPAAINTLIDEHDKQNQTFNYSATRPIGFMLVTGCGLGYHLEGLSQNFDIRHLCIFDSQLDSFFASLHTLDWVTILKMYSRKGRSLRLFIGVDETQAITEIHALRDTIGLQNLVYTHIFQHLSGKEENHFLQQYLKQYPLIAAATGYFDDEQISLAHTVAHMATGPKVLNSHQPSKTFSDRLPPAFVIGNGPSLDEHIAFLKEQEPTAIIISCGTALSSIIKAGIKPDFHIETERTAIIETYLIKGTSDQYRRGINLVCLNTVAPCVTALFDDFFIAVKPNDLGEHILNSHYLDNDTRPLTACNPTVTNAGLSFALCLGFSNIFLLGVDLGMQNGKSHHSGLSIHYDIERQTQKSGFTFFENEQNHYSIPANFGGEISTHPILHNTKVNMEILLRLYHHKDDNLKVYNPNRGAKIEGTKTIQPGDMAKLELFRLSEHSCSHSSVPDTQSELHSNKHQLVSHIKQKRFSQYPICALNNNDINAGDLAAFYDLENDIQIAAKIENQQQLLEELNRIHAVVLRCKEKSPASYQLIRGSVNFIFALIVRRVWFLDSLDDFTTSLNFCRYVYNQFISDSFTKMRTQPLSLDKTTDKVASQLADKML